MCHQRGGGGGGNQTTQQAIKPTTTNQQTKTTNNQQERQQPIKPTTTNKQTHSQQVSQQQPNSTNNNNQQATQQPIKPTTTNQQTNNQAKNIPAVIAETIDDNSPDPESWVEIQDPDDPGSTFILYADARSHILRKTSWLCDSEIHAGQLLLRNKFPCVDGLHNPEVSLVSW